MHDAHAWRAYIGIQPMHMHDARISAFSRCACMMHMHGAQSALSRCAYIMHMHGAHISAFSRCTCMMRIYRHSADAHA